MAPPHQRATYATQQNGKTLLSSSTNNKAGHCAPYTLRTLKSSLPNDTFRLYQPDSLANRHARAQTPKHPRLPCPYLLLPYQHQHRHQQQDDGKNYRIVSYAKPPFPSLSSSPPLPPSPPKINSPKTSTTRPKPSRRLPHLSLGVDPSLPESFCGRLVHVLPLALSYAQLQGRVSVGLRRLNLAQQKQKSSGKERLYMYVCVCVCACVPSGCVWDSVYDQDVNFLGGGATSPVHHVHGHTTQGHVYGSISLTCCLLMHTTFAVTHVAPPNP